MSSGNGKKSNKLIRTLAYYNMIPNLIWSALNLTPISVYWYTLYNYKTFYIFLAVSLIPIFFKNSFLDNLQIGKTTKIYRQLGVHFINKVAQNGIIINNLVKKKFPEHKVVSNNKTSIAKLISQSYMFEKFHLILFLFFSFTIVYAGIKGHLLWACIILANNIAFNIYPNLLQQYIRIKLILFNKKITRNSTTEAASRT